MSWFKQHADTIAILSTFALCFWHLNEKIAVIEKDMAVVKTVLLIKGIMPESFVKRDIHENQSS